MSAAGCSGKLFAQPANQTINDPGFGRNRSPIKVGENHLLRQKAPSPQAEQLEDAVFLLGQANGLVLYRDNFGIEINVQLAGSDRRCRRFGVVFGTAGARLTARYPLSLHCVLPAKKFFDGQLIAAANLLETDSAAAYGVDNRGLAPWDPAL
jgi:hypothetical protein